MGKISDIGVAYGITGKIFDHAVAFLEEHAFEYPLAYQMCINLAQVAELAMSHARCDEVSEKAVWHETKDMIFQKAVYEVASAVASVSDKTTLSGLYVELVKVRHSIDYYND